MSRADGREIPGRGQAAFENGKPFYRTNGPDLTGLFVHDAGALGIKILVTMRLMQKPRYQDYASFVFASGGDTATAMSDIARSGRVEEVYVLDPEATRRTLDASSMRADVKRLLNVVKSQGQLSRGIKEGMAMVGAGRRFVADDVYTLHVVCAGDSDRGVEEDLEHCRALVERNHGGEIANLHAQGRSGESV